MTDKQDKVIFRDLEKQYGFAQISQKNKGIVNSEDIADSLIFTRTQIRTAQVDGTKPLSNPAGLFVKTLKDLQEKRKRKDQLSKLETMRAKFLEKSKF